MSRVSTYTLDHQWDPYEILNVERDRRCNGWLPSMGRKCRNVVNWKDMDTFYRLLDDLSSHALDTTRLQPRLRALAAVGLCKQVHRCSQIDDTVDKWSKKIRAAARRVELEELEVESYYSRTDTRSSTASFRAPASRRTRSSTSTDTARTSSTAQDEIDSTLRCLEAARDQQRILERRLVSLQSPNTSRTQRAIRDRINPAPSLSDSSSVVSSRTLRSHVSTSSRLSTSTHSTLSSSSSDSSSPSDHRRPSRISSSPAAPSQSTVPRQNAPSHASTVDQTPRVAAMNTSTPISTDASTPLQQDLILLWRDFLTSQVSRGTIPASRLSDYISTSPFLSTDALGNPPSTTSTEPTSLRLPPRCAQTHVRRLPIADECPICYETMAAEEGPVWCKSGCGQSVHAECMDTWRATLVAGGEVVRCTMCRGSWEERECEC